MNGFNVYWIKLTAFIRRFLLSLSFSLSLSPPAPRCHLSEYTNNSHIIFIIRTVFVFRILCIPLTHSCDTTSSKIKTKTSIQIKSINCMNQLSISVVFRIANLTYVYKFFLVCVCVSVVAVAIFGNSVRLITNNINVHVWIPALAKIENVRIETTVTLIEFLK